VLVWSPLAKGMLSGKYRQAQPQPDTARAKMFPKQWSDERNLDAVERLIPIAQEAGMSLIHMAMAFVVAHPAVTSAIIGPRTMQHLDDLLAGAEVKLGDEVLDKIDTVVAPGTDSGAMGATDEPPAMTQPNLRRRPLGERSAV
jgi:aryl-alcohol dehydrogenase (NADP+)